MANNVVTDVPNAHRAPPPTAPDGALTIACVAEPSPWTSFLVETITTVFPQASVECVDPSTDRETPKVDCLVVDSSVGSVPALEVVLAYRARGYEGSVVILADRADPPSSEARALGAALVVSKSDLVTGLAPAIAASLAARDGSAAGSPSAAALAALRRVQRLMAMGELSRRLQHSLNNPLAALLAEAQLLELEEMPAEHRESVRRIVELTRRVISHIRGLDGVSEG
jgi:signal transduction histidine kinase